MKDNTFIAFLLQSSKLLYSFEDNGDYTYDVQWSPIHPALFATADIMGRLDIWNLNKDTEVSLLSFHYNYEHGGEIVYRFLQ